jgi:hypothetical protein
MASNRPGLIGNISSGPRRPTRSARPIYRGLHSLEPKTPAFALVAMRRSPRRSTACAGCPKQRPPWLLVILGASEPVSRLSCGQAFCRGSGMTAISLPLPAVCQSGGKMFAQCPALVPAVVLDLRCGLNQRPRRRDRPRSCAATRALRRSIVTACAGARNHWLDRCSIALSQ